VALIPLSCTCYVCLHHHACLHCHRRKLAGCDFRELPKLSRSMIRALDDLVDKDIRDVIMKNGGVKRIFKVCLLYTMASNVLDVSA
jgi:hypothetical protein